MLLSSNEMFIKYGLIDFIQEHKNGLQLVKFDKNIENTPNIKNMLKFIKMDHIWGGQAEGQFYEKEVFETISTIYLKFFNSDNYFETEEIIPQTIFKSLNLPYSLPITLQNYSNNIVFTPQLIQTIIKNAIIIPEETPILNTLCSLMSGQVVNLYFQ